MAGIILITINANFHCTASATMNPEKNSETPCTHVYSFSAIP